MAFETAKLNGEYGNMAETKPQMASQTNGKGRHTRWHPYTRDFGGMNENGCAVRFGFPVSLVSFGIYWCKVAILLLQLPRPRVCVCESALRACVCVCE